MFGADCGQTKERSRLGYYKIKATIPSAKDWIFGIANVRAYIGAIKL